MGLLKYKTLILSDFIIFLRLYSVRKTLDVEKQQTGIQKIWFFTFLVLSDFKNQWIYCSNPGIQWRLYLEQF